MSKHNRLLAEKFSIHAQYAHELRIGGMYGVKHAAQMMIEHSKRVVLAVRHPAPSFDVRLD